MESYFKLLKTLSLISVLMLISAAIPKTGINTKINELIQGYNNLEINGGIYVSISKNGTHWSEDYLSPDGLVNENTLFGIASVNKTITSAALFKLKEAGVVSFEDKLKDFFDDIPEDKEDITIKQLLTHTSGIADDYIMEGIVNAKEARQKLFREDLLFNPGDGFKYSSDAFNILAMIIEKITHQTYEEYVRMSVLKPLGMKDTYFWSEVITNKTPSNHNIAPLSQPFPESWNGRNWGFIGSGGIFMTLNDLKNLSSLFSTNKVLSNDYISQMVTPVKKIQSSTLGELGIGYGCFKGYDNDKVAYIASGSEDYGHNAIIKYFPKEGLTIVVLTSTILDGDRPASKLIANDIVKSLL